MTVDKGPEQHWYGWYIACVLDLLGQREALRQWPIPMTASPPADLWECLRNTVGEVSVLRDDLAEASNHFAREAVRKHEPVPTHEADAFIRMTRWDIRTCWFSDTVIIYAPLGRDRPAPVSLSDVWWTIELASAAFMKWLARGHPVRGSIDVGVGTDYFPNEVYGPVVYQVTQLEKKAGAPRIVLGGALSGLLSVYRDGPVLNGSEALNRYWAQKASQMTFLDVDGRPCVDYAGEMALRDLPDDWRDIPARALAFANRQQEQFRQEGDEKLTPRWQQVCQYLQSRLGNDSRQPA